MKLSAHPLWLVGFRPFFSLACLSGLSLPVLWVLVYSGVVAAPPGPFSAVQWHAHEMFFGFGWAVLGGFLLTSTKNWVRVRGYHGRALIFLAAAWVFERIGMWFGGGWPSVLFELSNKLFLVSIVALLLWTLIRHRDSDSYRDNALFLVVLPLFVVAKHLMLQDEHFPLGANVAVGLFRVAFLVMLERTLSTFMKGAFQVTILRQPALDGAIKLLGLLLVFENLLPAPLAGALALLLAALLGGRFVFWKPHLAIRRPDIGVMFLGYLAIIAQLLIAVIGRVAEPAWVGSLAVHVFTFGAMGLIVPAMMIRIAKGHTGRKVVFDAPDNTVLRIMTAAFAARVVAPQIYPAGYLYWIVVAAACWFAGFSLLAWRYIPYLARARVDGKEH
ncbi:MAG: NnrS family protein [Betaproteobacteria bacterium]|nr:NnrS family protein [Betaproteobacteria bacterium]